MIIKKKDGEVLLRMVFYLGMRFDEVNMQEGEVVVSDMWMMREDKLEVIMWSWIEVFFFFCVWDGSE